MPELPPGWVLMAGALAVPLLPARLRAAWVLMLTALSAWLLHRTPDHVAPAVEFLGLTLHTVQLDALSRLFAWAFHAALGVATVYALRERDGVQLTAAPLYAGAAIAATCAGDLITLFVFWELTAVSTALVWATRTESALRAGLRYLLWQVGSGVAMLIGIALLTAAGHERLDPVAVGSVGALALMLGLGVKAGFPALHCWVPDAYPRATPAGAVYLSLFSTKLAIYALARLYAGAEVLVVLGAISAVGATVYAAAQDDLRRLLAYVLVAQLGVSVVGIGLGGGALDGAVRHAIAGQAYLGLLFMATGAVLTATGSVRISQVAGVAWRMPLTALAVVAGGLTAAGLPLLAGYPGKTLILDEAVLAGTEVWLALSFTAAGTAYLCALRLPWALLGPRPAHTTWCEAPPAQLAGMALAAAACAVLGLVGLPGNHVPLNLAHAGTQCLLLAGVAVVFALAVASRTERRDVYATPPEVDWALRVALPETFIAGRTAWREALTALGENVLPATGRMVATTYERYFSPRGLWGSAWPTGRILLYTAAVLGAYLVASFV